MTPIHEHEQDGTDPELQEAYEFGFRAGYWSEDGDWIFGTKPRRRYRTKAQALLRGILDGIKKHERDRRRVAEILADPSKMVADSETLQLLNNEVSRKGGR